MPSYREGQVQNAAPARKVYQFNRWVFCGQSIAGAVGVIIVELWCDRHRRSIYFDSLRSATRPRGTMLRIHRNLMRDRNILPRRRLISTPTFKIETARKTEV